MLVGDKVKYCGSLTEYHGIYTIKSLPTQKPYTRGYALEHASGKLLLDVSIHSIVLV